MKATYNIIGVIGAGAMGRGIAQIAVQAGAHVKLLDMSASAAQQARQSLHTQWDRLGEKSRLSADQVAACKQRLSICSQMDELADCDLVIEAIVEKLEIKQALFTQLEALLPTTAVLATNTSSLSVTAIASVLQHPSRFAGFHFFNPVPLMKVVEVVAGLRTAPQVCEGLASLARQMGHSAVLAQDTPGFIVNHAGRGYGTEALRIVGESVADFSTIDAVLRDQLGFKLGPFELMDLTALDVSHPVMESIYHQYFEEPRYRPSVITAQRLAGAMLGRKTGQGFYSYAADGSKLPVAVVDTASELPHDSLPPVWVSPRASRRAELLALLHNMQISLDVGVNAGPSALILVAPLGFDVTTIAAVDRLDASRTVGIDMLVADANTRRRVLACNPATRDDVRAAAAALLGRDGKPVSVLRDSAGFVSQRVAAHIINIACDMCQQGICSPADLDTAVTLGLGYPLGPLALGDALGPANVLEVLFNMQTVYGDPRYRPSPWLRRRAALGLSLAHTEHW
jgi:3-hydroxybutyryl-CoA dehydrogenase